MATLIIAEHDNNHLNAATLHALTAAKQLGSEIDILVAGQAAQTVAQQAAALPDVRRVKLAEDAAFAEALAENVAAQVLSLADEYEHIVFAATSSGKNIAPRVAAKLDVAQVSDVVAIESSDTFTHPIYAGNALATVQTQDAKKVLTIRTTAFESANAEGGSAEIVTLTPQAGFTTVQFVKRELDQSDRPDLAAASVVIAGGRGLGSAENFKLLEPLADKLGAAIGASRAAVDAGYAPNDWQVGQTGKIVAPQLYMAFGVSGAIQHLAGMKDSKVIVAVNKDPDAAIFSVADYGLVADVFDVLPELTQAL
ncbi:MAG TPA: FAD-binding protein [Candidatus Paenalcaligenes intestinipullorum]|uniref:Electron transfer flavoprotein subunit alpha n=1 Tax=Candidatus Paenalcaligenes intestinipullorum TaxID=2838718 RepID=A0A9D2RJT9_9BURK|nr:FAD-binding protein [Candidatus Paenalcaligenes intestinipullorum]